MIGRGGIRYPATVRRAGEKEVPSLQKRISTMAKNNIIKTMKALRKQAEKEQKAEAKLAKIRADLRHEQEMYRNDHRKLAKAIADLIRADNRPGEDPADFSDAEDMADGFHWFQNAWGKVVIEDGAIAPVEVKISKDRYGHSIYGNDPIYQVTCPTTGCVAGWAASLAGFPMALTSFVNSDLSAIIDRNRGEVYQTDDCIDKEKKQLVSISDKGAELLNLNVDQKDWLFSGYRELKEVLWGLDQIAETGTFNPENYERTDSSDCLCPMCR
jgi:hypothetical protein